MSYKRVSAKGLLLGMSMSRVTNSGIDWIISPCGFARASVVYGDPKSTFTVSVSSFRALAAKTRADVRPATAVSTNHLIGGDLLIRTGRLYTAINPVAWRAWTRTGLTPRVNKHGTVLWFGEVRGKEAVFGAISPVYIRPAAA